MGGSFISDRPHEVRRLRGVLKRVSRNAIVVVGGGDLAREYIRFAGLLGLTKRSLHRVGIKATLINAFILSEVLDGEFFDGDPRRLRKRGLIVTGGFKPGWTTDTCAAYAAVSSGADVIFNISKEKGVYDMDPEKFRNAKLLRHIKFDELRKMTGAERKPGMNFIFDPMAATICKRHKIKVVVTNRITDVADYLKNGTTKGTIID